MDGWNELIDGIFLFFLTEISRTEFFFPFFPACLFVCSMEDEMR